MHNFVETMTSNDFVTLEKDFFFQIIFEHNDERDKTFV